MINLMPVNLMVDTGAPVSQFDEKRTQHPGLTWQKYAAEKGEPNARQGFHRGALLSTIDHEITARLRQP
jgi:hypothetical protein